MRSCCSETSSRSPWARAAAASATAARRNVAGVVRAATGGSRARSSRPATFCVRGRCRRLQARSDRTAPLKSARERRLLASSVSPPCKIDAQGGVGRLLDAARGAARTAAAAHERGERVVARPREVDLGVGRAHVEAAAVVASRRSRGGPARAGARPCFSARRGSRPARRQHSARRPRSPRVRAAVEELPETEQEHELLVVLEA